MTRDFAGFIWSCLMLVTVGSTHAQTFTYFETIIESERVSVGEDISVYLRNTDQLCPYFQRPASPHWILNEVSIDIYVYVEPWQFLTPSCSELGRRYFIPAPNIAGRYDVRVYFVTEPDSLDPRFLQAESSIEVLPPLPIPATHLWAQGLMALSLLGIGTVFARLRTRA